MISVNGKQVLTKTECPQGEVGDLDISKYIKSGANTVVAKVVDRYGSSDLYSGIITGVDVKLTSDFNTEKIWGDGPLGGLERVAYSYKPFGDVKKTAHIIVDEGTAAEKTFETIIPASRSGEKEIQNISGLSHGSHSIKAYFDAELGTDIVKSNILTHEFIYHKAGNNTPIVAINWRQPERGVIQYMPFSVPYFAYTPGKPDSTVKVTVNGELLYDNLIVGQKWNSFSYKAQEPGMYTFEVSTGGVTKSITIHVEPSTVNPQASETALALFLNADGKDNDKEDTRGIWEYTRPDGTKVTCDMDKFNWSSNG